MVKFRNALVGLLVMGLPALGRHSGETRAGSPLKVEDSAAYPKEVPEGMMELNPESNQEQPQASEEGASSEKSSLKVGEPLSESLGEPLPLEEPARVSHDSSPRGNARRPKGMSSEEEMDQQRLMSEKYHERESSAEPDSGPDSGPKAASDRVVVGYYADWKARDLPPEKVPYEKLTHINYAFAIIKEETMEPYFETDYLLPRVVKAAHEKRVKVLLSVGGWTGSKHFSPIAADPAKRGVLVTKLVELTNKFELDGIDIDWEFPGRQGMACNAYNGVSDSANFVVLLRELRLAMDARFPAAKKLITLAVRVEPIDGPAGPLTDASELAATVDFVNVMAYDINGPWSSTTGPNAPLRHKAGKGFQLSFMSGVKSWLGAKFPSDKLVMGLAFYGRSFEVSQEIRAEEAKNGDSFYVQFAKSVPQGDKDDAMWSDPCPGSPYTYSGVWQWKNLREQGLLKTPVSAGAEWSRFYDEVTHTPWLYSPTRKLLISYDDPMSLGHKVNYARCNNLRGVMAWALHEDNVELLDAVQPIRSLDSPSLRGACEMYQRIDRAQTQAAQSNRTLAGANKTPFKSGSYGLMSSISRHPPAHRHRLLQLPDKVFSA